MAIHIRARVPIRGTIAIIPTGATVIIVLSDAGCSHFRICFSTDVMFGPCSREEVDDERKDVECVYQRNDPFKNGRDVPFADFLSSSKGYI